MFVLIFLHIDVMLDSSFTFPSVYLQIRNMLLQHFTQVLHSDVIPALPAQLEPCSSSLTSWQSALLMLNCDREGEVANGLVTELYMECSQSKHM